MFISTRHDTRRQNPVESKFDFMINSNTVFDKDVSNCIYSHVHNILTRVIIDTETWQYMRGCVFVCRYQ